MENWIRVIKNYYLMKGFEISDEYALILARNKFKLTMNRGKVVRFNKYENNQEGQEISG